MHDHTYIDRYLEANQVLPLGIGRADVHRMKGCGTRPICAACSLRNILGNIFVNNSIRLICHLNRRS